MKGQTEFSTTHWILVVLFISRLATAETEKRWRFLMLMIPATAQSHLQPQIVTWVAFVRGILQQDRQRVSSAGIDNRITVHSERVALAMEF